MTLMSQTFRMTTRLLVIALLLVSCGTAVEATDPSDVLPPGGWHRPLTDGLPPGVVGQARLAGRGPVAGYFQPVAFSGPAGVEFSFPNRGMFSDTNDSPRVGLMIGAIYRFRITGIPLAAGAELYPTIEVIDRTYPPPGLAARFPIQVNLDQEDLDAALSGRMVTRVILLEDPQTAVAVAQQPTTSSTFEISEQQDALEVADRLGRPVAIVRIGSLAPPRSPQLLPQFFFGYPAWTPVELPAETAATAEVAQRPPQP